MQSKLAEPKLTLFLHCVSNELAATKVDYNRNFSKKKMKNIHTQFSVKT